MGCTSSKRVKATTDVYRPPPSSFAVFNINSIEEPWLMVDKVATQEAQEKPTHVPIKILEKLNTFEAMDAPKSWEEVSKALEDLKPAMNNNKHSENEEKRTNSPAATSPPKPAELSGQRPNPRKTFSFHTLEELDANTSSKPAASPLRKTESLRTEAKNVELNLNKPEAPVNESTGFNSVKNNIFIVRDRREREKEGRRASIDRLMSKRDPLSDFPEKCPPAGADSVVIYTTSLRGVRRTYEDCAAIRSILEVQRVVFDERDVSLHGEFLNELRGLLGEGASVPRVFAKGRYLGGVEEVSELNETGRLGRILNQARVERGVGRQACEGCGGARFVPCLECSGSCRLVVGDKKERCGKCNENGLVHCPACL